MKTILVTGVGAIIGYGVLKSLRKDCPELRLIGTDIYPDAVGRVWTDQFEQAMKTADSNYLEWLVDISKRHAVDLIIPGIEQDLYRHSEAREELKSRGVSVALNNASLIGLSRDKWLMHQKLVELNESSRIPSYLSGTFEELSTRLGLPFLLKPRCGYASKGLVRINNAEQFNQFAPGLGVQLMAQPVIGSDEEEYTVSIFGDGTGGISASITLRRKLAADGSTAKAWLSPQPGLNDVVERLARRFSPLGATNLQFRKDGEDWKLLEINPRISSATSIRCALGYNESKMSVDYFLNGNFPVQPVLRNGFATRYIEDHVIYDRDHF